MSPEVTFREAAKNLQMLGLDASVVCASVRGVRCRERVCALSEYVWMRVCCVAEWNRRDIPQGDTCPDCYTTLCTLLRRWHTNLGSACRKIFAPQDQLLGV